MMVNCVCCFGGHDISNSHRYCIDGKTAYSCGSPECEDRIPSLTKQDVEDQVMLTGANAAQCKEWMKARTRMTK